MKNVIVLTNDEHKNHQFLNRLGWSISHPMMCAVTIPTQIFNYQIFSILVTDSKLLDYVKTRDGIIILVDNVNTQILNNITNIVNSNQQIPVMIVLDGPNHHNHILKPLIKISGHKYIFLNDTSLKDSLYTNPFDSNLYHAKSWFNSILKRGINSVLKDTAHQKKLTSITIPIDEMAKQFENCTLGIDLWDHYGRLKIVYYSLQTHGVDNTINSEGWLCTNWRKYKESIGHGNLWNYTLTRFWMHKLYNLMSKYKTFDDLYTANPDMQNGKLFQKYYTNDILFSSRAKNHWINPNLLSINN